MSDHEFEKKVQQRMGDLRLRPSDAVWAEVERNLRREKRRRRIVLWLPLMGILLTAGGYFIFTAPDKGGQESLAKTAPSEKTAAPNTTAAPSSSTATASAPESKTKSSAKAETEPSSSLSSLSKNSNNPTSQNSTLPGNKPGSQALQKQAEATAPVADKPVAQKNITASKNRGNKAQQQVVTKGTSQRPSSVDKQESEPKIISTDKNIIDKKSLQKDVKEAKDKEEKGKTVIDSNIVVYNNETDAENKDADSVAKHIARLDSSQQKPVLVTTKRAIAKKQPSASKWQWGVSANVGVANISEGNLFDVLKAVRVDDLTGAGPQYNGIPPVPAPEPSPIRPGAAFSVGGFVQRNLSKRFSLSAGIQYSYFSVNTRVGRKVDSAVAVNYGTLSSQVTDNYYRADATMNDYVNRYHFIGLPVTASYRLLNIKKLPVVLDAGLSISRLLSTTALHFDGISRVYYENDDFFNRMQVSINGGLNLGFLQNSKHPLWIGPTLRYFTTGLVRKEISASGGEQHIWSFGLNAKMLLKK